MARAAITAKTQFIFDRNRLGEFAKECERAADRTVKRSVELGARTSRGMAPAGKERWRYDNRPGYVPLKKSIRTRMIGKHKGMWYSIAPHAPHVEFGTNAHWIVGKLKFSWREGFFWWDAKAHGPLGSGRGAENWTPGIGAWVWHPGTNAQPFLEPAYDRVVKRQMMDIAKQEFPG